MEKTETPDVMLKVGELGEMVKGWLREAVRTGEQEPRTNLPKFLTRAEVAKMLNLSLMTVDKYARNGVIKSRRVGNRVLFSESDIYESMDILPAKRNGKN